MSNDPKDPWRNFPGGNPFGAGGPLGPNSPFGGDPFSNMDEWIRSMGVEPAEFRRLFDEMQKGLQDALKSMGDDPSKGFVTGFNFRMGPDGKPHISSFGNRPTVDTSGKGMPRVGVDEREPLTDVIEDHASIAITMELPGVDKQDIDLKMTGERLDVSVDTERHKYHKSVRLPAKVDPSTTKATYKNGILDVTVQKVEQGDEGVKINVD